MSKTDLLRRGVFEGRGQPASNESLEVFERARSITLPSAYRAFLQEGDGGRFRQYNEIEGTFHGGLREVFALKDADASSRLLNGVLQIYAERVPAGFLPIADDLAGNLICLGLEGGERDQVFFWDHEMEVDEGHPPTMDNMEYLADSFDHFVDRVKIV